MSDLARLRIGDDPAIRGALAWYLDVAENRRPAKFRIAATVATGLDPLVSCEDALWAELDRLTPIFLTRWQAIRAGAPLPQAADGPSLLELCRELAYRMLAHCNFCPWNCRVDRVAGAKFGACKLASASRVSSHFHHAITMRSLSRPSWAMISLSYPRISRHRVEGPRITIPASPSGSLHCVCQFSKCR
jgi:putative pyruvate formate lyase activating enzyme